MSLTTFCLLVLRWTALFVAAVACAIAVFLIRLLVVKPWGDPLRDLPGPEGAFMQSHFPQVMDPELTPNTHEEWKKAYGKTFRIHGFGKFDLRLVSFDLSSVSHVLHSQAYEKPQETRHLLRRFLGTSVFTTEGTEHKLHTKITGPAFTTKAIKSLSPTILRKAEELRDLWKNQVLPSTKQETPCSLEAPVIDVCHWLHRGTFDAFGLVAFNHDFRALRDTASDIYTTYRKMFDTVDKFGVLHLIFPFLDKIWPEEATRVATQCLSKIHEFGLELIRSKSESQSLDDENDYPDILGLLLKSNQCPDNGKQLSDPALLDQISSFLFAGSDSTAVAITWCLHFLSKHPEIQASLRQELKSIASYLGDEDSDKEGCIEDAIDEILDLKLLDGVVKETLRLCSPIHSTLRLATEDDVIPTSHPITLENGKVVEQIHVRKGTIIHIPIEGLNHDTDVWGEDAMEFNPERWPKLPKSATNFPGLANVMTFLMGRHSCAGYRLALAQMKIFLAVLLLEFDFRDIKGIDIGRCNGILLRPYVKGKLRSGFQLPLSVERCNN